MTREKNFPGGSGELRTYKSGKTYRPKVGSERKIGVRRPADPRAVRFYGTWLLPLDVLPDEQRVLPETRPDEEAYDHMARRFGCDCDVCARPQAKRYQARWRRHQGLKG